MFVPTWGAPKRMVWRWGMYGRLIYRGCHDWINFIEGGHSSTGAVELFFDTADSFHQQVRKGRRFFRILERVGIESMGMKIFVFGST